MSTLTELLRAGKKKEIWERCCGYLDLDAGAYMEIQRELLRDQLARAVDCELWRSISKGERPRDLDYFRRRMPITTYRDYEAHLLPKNEGALPEKPRLWVHTSGRSGEYEAKWLPYTSGMFARVGEAFLAAFLVASARRRGEVRLREGMRFPYLLAPPPYISGVITESLLETFPFTVLPQLSRAASLGFQERIKEAFECALAEGIDFFWGMTSILMKLGESFGSGGGKGSLPKDPRALLRVLLGLARAGFQGRALMPKDLWRVKGAICGGMDTTILKDKVAELWGVLPMEGYGSTEFGAIAFQSWGRELLTFYPYMNFWEFLREEDYRRLKKEPGWIPDTFLLDEVEAGTDYVLVGTNFHGGALLRYVLGDLVRIEALEDQDNGIRLPQMSFVSRIDGLIDIGGFTRLTEKTIWRAVEAAGLPYEDWTARKEVLRGRPVLHLYLEPRAEIPEAQAYAALLHERLRELDRAYRDMEDIADMRPLEVTFLSKGSFGRYFEERQAAGADLAQAKPAHVNVSDAVIEKLLRMSDWRL